MADQSLEAKQKPSVTRRTFLGTTLAGGAALFAGGSRAIFGADSSTAPTMVMNPTWQLGGDLPINRLGFGAMRITGDGIWGWPADRQTALKVLRRAVELGVNLIDTADAYGPETSELLIAEALHPYPKGLVVATKGGLTRPGSGQWVPNGRPEYLKQCVREESKAATARAYRFVSIAQHRSQGAHGGIARSAQGNAGDREDSARGIIERGGGGNRAGAQGSSDRECPEPVQH